MKVNRRTFLRSSLASSCALAAGSPLSQSSAALALPAPDASGVDHIVVVMMENRSFDHLLGWLWTADGRQAGLSYTDAHGAVHATHRLWFDYKGCGHPDPDHSYGGARVQYDAGRMDGFLRSGSNDVYAIGYYGAADLPFYSSLAACYTTLDAYFCSILGPTFPNRIFQHAAQTDRLDDSLQVSTLPTIWDRLLEAGVSARYYYSNLPFLAMWGDKYIPLAASFQQFLDDAHAGTLPAVSFLDPAYTVLGGIFSNDDHPHADVRAGDAFLARVFDAVSSGPGWPRTVLIVNFDEWGGFFDHVPPVRAAAANAVDQDIVQGRTLLGFRVPTVVASPFTRGFSLLPRVSHLTCDHTSVLKLIEWRWGLAPLTARDASTDVANLAQVLRFDSPVTQVPALPHPSAPAPAICFDLGIDAADSTSEWVALATSGLMAGWPTW